MAGYHVWRQYLPNAPSAGLCYCIHPHRWLITRKKHNNNAQFLASTWPALCVILRLWVVYLVRVWSCYPTLQFLFVSILMYFTTRVPLHSCCDCNDIGSGSAIKSRSLSFDFSVALIYCGYFQRTRERERKKLCLNSSIVMRKDIGSYEYSTIQFALVSDIINVIFNW